MFAEAYVYKIPNEILIVALAGLIAAIACWVTRTRATDED